MFSALVAVNVEPVIKQEENTLQSLNRALKEGDKYTIIINKKNEAQQTVSFRAINPDGTTPGLSIFLKKKNTQN